MRCLHVGLDSPAQFDTIDLRHHDVTDYQIRILVNRTLFPLFTITCLQHLIEFLQLLFQEGAEFLVVFDNQQPFPVITVLL